MSVYTPDHLATHVFIPDTQARPNVPTDHLRWAGQYIVDQFWGKPHVKLIHGGDHWDMPSLSSYDHGKKAAEGRRAMADIEAGNYAWKILNGPLISRQELAHSRKEKVWRPERQILLRGNHEARITRATEDDAKLDGLLSLDLLQSPGWEVHDFLEPVEVDGIVYSHYFYNPMTGNAYSGNAQTLLKTLGHSFTQGHRQTYDAWHRFVNGRMQRGLIAGAFYIHDEAYKGPQGNAHWRGLIVCHEVHDGAYNLMEVSLDYLCRRYEGMDLETYKQYRGYESLYSRRP